MSAEYYRHRYHIALQNQAQKLVEAAESYIAKAHSCRESHAATTVILVQLNQHCPDSLKEKVDLLTQKLATIAEPVDKRPPSELTKLLERIKARN